MAAEQLDDKEKHFRVRARRRLIGAVALVLLMVTVLPMVLDDRGNARAPQPEIAITIPSPQNAEFSSKIVPVTPPSAPTAPLQMASPLERPQPAATPGTKAPPAASAPPEAAASKSVAVAKPASTPTPQPKAQPAPTAGKGGFAVQVGVFSDATKVGQMRKKIAEKGVSCYTENLDTPKGAKIRLRCGPYQDRAEAQQALDTLKAAGFGGILVTTK
jgi:DedD protein